METNPPARLRRLLGEQWSAQWTVAEAIERACDELELLRLARLDAERYHLLRFLLCEDASGEWPSCEMTMDELDCCLDTIITNRSEPQPHEPSPTCSSPTHVCLSPRACDYHGKCRHSQVGPLASSEAVNIPPSKYTGK